MGKVGGSGSGGGGEGGGGGSTEKLLSFSKRSGLTLVIRYIY